ncbi:hypothetical protein [Peribacillus simplex]|uniref:hypothetical protein n=1 Tax=Peribacillus simplex TaxID=1478 RepID=UPI00333D1214
MIDIVWLINYYPTEMLVFAFFFFIFFFLISIKYWMSTNVVLFFITAGLCGLVYLVDLPQAENRVLTANILLYLAFSWGGNFFSAPFVCARWFISLVESYNKK